MLSRLETLRPLRQHRLAEILFDRLVELRSLDRGQRNLIALANTLSRDERTRWFSVIKNHTDPPRTERISVDVFDYPARAAVIRGEVPEEFVASQRIWLSFSGTELFESAQVVVDRGNSRDTILGNCANLQSLIRDWPVYVASTKHRLEEYVRNGDAVSPMDLSQTDAQAALLVARDFGGSRYAMVRSKIYRFLPTNTGASPPTFHGFRVANDQVPAQVYKLLEGT